jgi:hypothetical protein
MKQLALHLLNLFRIASHDRYCPLVFLQLIPRLRTQLKCLRKSFVTRRIGDGFSPADLVGLQALRHAFGLANAVFAERQSRAF